ncbi:hypothetical protein EXN66_Car002186 [Channa argus]|uniref:Uncharacterized protein n=1 Tax=Channa argus TaxID=215402 RepID=A0A6G1P8R7_CHAAH|nr:hypothetical protein EXN66_Car002186 [Channa argus]
MSEHNPSYEVQGIVCRPPRQDCIDAQIWRRNISAALKVPVMVSIMSKWKRFGTTRTLPRAGRLAKLSNRERRALVGKVTKNQMITLTELQHFSV